MKKCIFSSVYEKPEAAVCRRDDVAIICDSPSEGGIEGVDYDDWVI